MNDEISAKEKIFKAALELLSGGEDPGKVTTRQIAAKAGVNLALVNYYYRSKETLMSEVVGIMMEGIIGPIMDDSGGDAESRLRNILITTADAAFAHYNICKVALSAELKQGCGNSCAMVMPLLKEIFDGLSLMELDIISMQLMLPFHHIFLEPELYGRLLKTNFFDKQKRDEIINEMIESILAKERKSYEH